MSSCGFKMYKKTSQHLERYFESKRHESADVNVYLERIMSQRYKDLNVLCDTLSSIRNQAPLKIRLTR